MPVLELWLLLAVVLVDVECEHLGVKPGSHLVLGEELAGAVGVKPPLHLAVVDDLFVEGSR